MRDVLLNQACDALWRVQVDAVMAHGRFVHYADADALRSVGVPVPDGWQARCDEYLGPQGVGYVLHVVADGDVCAVAVGPELGWAHAWRPVTADEEGVHAE